MKILFDTNVVLDLLLDREPFVAEATQLFLLVERGDITGVLCASTITTIHYLATKAVGIKNARQQITKLLQLFEVAAVNRAVLENALQLQFTDYEDAVLYESARHNGTEIIVTRDKGGFKKSKLTIYTPQEFLNAISLVK